MNLYVLLFGAFVIKFGYELVIALLNILNDVDDLPKLDIYMYLLKFSSKYKNIFIKETFLIPLP